LRRKLEARVSFAVQQQSCCVAQVGLELSIFLPPPPKYWVYKHMPPHLGLNIILKGITIKTN
jgi:hypothetical protein